MANAVNNAAKIKTLLQFMSRQLRHLGMTPKEAPLLIVLFKLLLHRYSFNLTAEGKSTNIFSIGQIFHTINVLRTE